MSANMTNPMQGKLLWCALKEGREAIMLNDMTLFKAASGNYAFKPHNAKADAFLKAQFELDGRADRDMTVGDCLSIVQAAERSGLTVKGAWSKI